MNNFQRSLEFTLKWEGKLSNDPADPGGMTYRGISRKFHPFWEGWQYVDQQDWANADLCLEGFYMKYYWVPSGAGHYEFPLSCSVFDAAVNCGVKRALGWLEVSQSVDTFNNMRENYYNTLVEKKPARKKFLKGWLNRLNSLREVIKDGL